MHKNLDLAYSNLNDEQVEIEFQNLMSRIDYYLSIGHIDNASAALIELEYNANYKRSERKMYFVKLMNDKFYRAMGGAV